MARYGGSFARSGRGGIQTWLEYLWQNLSYRFGSFTYSECIGCAESSGGLESDQQSTEKSFNLLTALRSTVRDHIADPCHPLSITSRLHLRLDGTAVADDSTVQKELQIFSSIRRQGKGSAIL